jgi:hypothetical protein
LRIKSERDFWSGLVFVVVGVGFAVAATHYSMGPSCAVPDPCAADPGSRLAQLASEPGPGYFPLGLGILLAIVGAVILFKSLVLEAEIGDPIGAFAWRPLLAIVGAIALFGALIEPLGLVLTGPLLVAVSTLASDRGSRRGLIVQAVVLTFGTWLVFVCALKLPIPLWPRWFE